MKKIFDFLNGIIFQSGLFWAEITSGTKIAYPRYVGCISEFRFDTPLPEYLEVRG